MSYQVIIKTIKNHDYGYLYMSYYDKSTKQSKKKFIKYLGPVHSKKVQNAIAELRAGKKAFFKRKRRKRMPEIELEDIQELSPWEKIFFATAVVVKEKAKTAYLEDVIELAKEYCKKAKIVHPAAWDQSVDYFKTLGWIELKAGKIKFLLSQKQLREIKKIILLETSV